MSRLCGNVRRLVVLSIVFMYTVFLISFTVNRSAIKALRSSDSAAAVQEQQRVHANASATGNDEWTTRKDDGSPIPPPKVNQTLPPLESLIQNSTIVGDVSFLLDAAILGFAKCGTTTLSGWFDNHPEMKSIPQESFALLGNQPQRLTKWLYAMRQDSATYKKQLYKQPKDAYTPHVLATLDQYWPRAKLIYTLRHPVTWFESYYNFRNWKENTPIPHTVIGRQGTIPMMSYKLHTGLGEFHIFMAMLGKTAQTAEDEWKLIEPFLKGPDEKNLYPFPKVQNPVFFVESSQLSDRNATRAAQLRHDLSNFLGLSTPLPKTPHIKPETLWMTPEQLRLREQNRVNICEDQYVTLRGELLRMGDAASKWLRLYFMKSSSEGVHFSSGGGYLERVLESWSVDPCVERNKKR